MPDWIIPLTVASLGGGGLGAVISAIIAKRPTRLDPFAQLQAIVDNQGHRITEQDARIDGLYTQVGLYREYNASLLAWVAAGAPPPPPERPSGLI